MLFLVVCAAFSVLFSEVTSNDPNQNNTISHVFVLPRLPNHVNAFSHVFVVPGLSNSVFSHVFVVSKPSNLVFSHVFVLPEPTSRPRQAQAYSRR